MAVSAVVQDGKMQHVSSESERNSCSVSIVKDHKRQKAISQRRLEVCKREAIASVEATTTAYVKALNEGVSRVYSQQLELDKEAKTLQGHTQAFTNHTNKWLDLYKSFNESLLELGDVEGWVQQMESQLNTVSSRLEQVVLDNQRLEQQKLEADEAKRAREEAQSRVSRMKKMQQKKASTNNASASASAGTEANADASADTDANATEKPSSKSAGSSDAKGS